MGQPPSPPTGLGGGVIILPQIELTYLLTYILAYLLTYFLAYLLAYLLTYLLTHLLTHAPYSLTAIPLDPPLGHLVAWHGARRAPITKHRRTRGASTLSKLISPKP